MSGMTMNNSIPFDPFSTSYLVKDQQAFDFSPVALFNPLEDFSADFGFESPASPELESPISPNSFAFPALSSPDNVANPSSDSWTGLDSLSSPELFLKAEAFDEDPVLDSISPASLSASPSVNPMDLSASQILGDDVPFGGSGGGLIGAENMPLFPSPQLARAQNPTTVNRNALSISIPQQAGIERPPHGLKRKSSECSSSGSSPRSSPSSPRSSPSPPPHMSGSGRRTGGGKDAHLTHLALPPKKTAHNMIEKRYRNNLNDKISALRDAVPALRVMVHRLEAHQNGAGSPGPEEELDVSGRNSMSQAQDLDEDLGGLTPAHKLNKATILAKATEYIAHLERRNRSLARENQGLRGKVEGFEMLMMNGAARSVWC